MFNNLCNMKRVGQEEEEIKEEETIDFEEFTFFIGQLGYDTTNTLKWKAVFSKMTNPAQKVDL